MPLSYHSCPFAAGVAALTACSGFTAKTSNLAGATSIPKEGGTVYAQKLVAALPRLECGMPTPALVG